MAEDVVVSIRVNDQGSAAVKKFHDNLNRGLDGVGAKIKTTNSAFGSLSGSLLENTRNAFKVLPAYAAVGAAIGAVTGTIALAAKNFVEFDKELRAVASISEEVRQSFESTRKAIIAMDPALGTTAELSKALFETMSAGISVGRSMAENLKFTADAAKFAQAALINNADAVKILSTTLQAFGADISKATRFGDIFQKTVVLGQFSAEELGSTLGRITPLASAMGVSFSEANAAVATLSQGGLDASEAITGLRQVFNNAIQNAEKFKAVGIDVAEVLAGPNGMVNFFTELRRVTGGNADAIKKFIPDVRALVAALSLTGPQFETLIEFNEQITDSFGESQKAFEENQKSIEAGFKRLLASFDRAAAQLGTGEFGEIVSTALGGLGKAIESAASGVENIAGVVTTAGSDWAKWIGQLDLATGGLLGVAGNAAKAGTGLASLVGAVSNASSITRKLLTGIGDLSGQLELTAEEAEKFGDALKRGGLGAQQALNAILKARNDAAKASRDLQIELAKEINILDSLGAVVDTVGQTYSQAGDKIELAETTLRGVGIAALDTIGKTEQLNTQLVDLINSTGNFTKGLDNLAGGFAKQQEVSAAQTKVIKDLTVSYGLAVNKVAETREALRALGATTDELNGKTAITEDAIAAMAEATGEAEHLVRAAVLEFQAWNIEVENTGRALKEQKVDIAGVTQEIQSLIGQTAAATNENVKLAAALQLVAGTNLSKLVTEANQVAQGIEFLRDKGGADLDFLVTKAEELEESFRAVGQEVPRNVEKLSEGLRQAANEARSVEKAFEQVVGVRFDKLVQETDKFAVNITKLAAAGKKFGTDLFNEVNKLSAQAQEVYGNKIPGHIQATIAAMSRLAMATTTVEQAFKKINGISVGDLQREIQQTAHELQLMADRGQIGSTRLNEELQRLKQRLDLLPESAQGALEPLIEDLEQSLPAVQSLKDSLNLLGTKTLVEMEQSAKLVGDAFVKAFESGEVTGKELVRIFESEVAPKYEAANMRLPSSLITAYEDSKRIAGEESKILGNQIGEVLGTGIAEGVENVVVNSVGQVINTIASRFKQEVESIKDRFDRIAPGTREPVVGVRFGSSLEDLERNKQQIRQLQLQTSTSTAAGRSSMEQLNKAMDEVNRRIRELHREQQRASESTSDFGRTGTNTFNSLTSGTNNLTSGFNRINTSIANATGSLEEFSSGLGTLTDFSFTANVSDPGGTDTSITTGISSGGTSGGSFFTGSTGGLFGRFQSGINFAQQGQLARLDSGEMVVPRDIAKRLRSLDLKQLSGGPGPAGAALFGAVTSGASIRSGPRSFVPGVGFVGSIVIGRRPSGSSLAQAGFQHVPGFGTVPTSAIASAAGNADQNGGANSQANQQRSIIPLVRGAIERRDLTRDISGATALTNKGQPSTGGS